MKKIFVTGADGFIGSHLVEALVRKGYDVKAMSLYNSIGRSGWLENIPKEISSQIEVVFGDIRDYHHTLKLMTGCQAVLHLAALIAIPYSYTAPESYVDTNIKGTLNILQAAQTLNYEKIIHTSTSEVYGSAQFVPIHEDHPLVGQSPYAATKIAADQIALSFYRSFDLPVAVARPFNTYGPRQSARAVIPTIITQILSGQTQIKLGDVTTTRDFNYCMDTANGMIAILEAEKAVGEVINIGSGFEITIAHTVELIASLIGKQIEIITDEKRIRPEKSEVERLCADPKKLKRLTNWQPECADLEGLKKGLQHTIEWFSKAENLALYRVGEYVL